MMSSEVEIAGEAMVFASGRAQAKWREEGDAGKASSILQIDCSGNSRVVGAMTGEEWLESMCGRAREARVAAASEMQPWRLVAAGW